MRVQGDGWEEHCWASQQWHQTYELAQRFARDVCGLKLQEGQILMDCLTAEQFRRACSFAAVVAYVAIASGGCTVKDPISSWDSPRLLEIKKEWDSLSDDAQKVSGKARAGKFGRKREKLDEMLNEILKTNLSKQDLHCLAATCGTLPIRAKDRTAFANSLLAYMERTFISSGDRENLVLVLSTRCQLHIAIYADIEYALALGEKIEDPILVLGEAYAKCQSAEVRHDIAGAVRRGFSGHGISGKEDTEFVENAMQWYKKEKGNLIVNMRYAQNAQGLDAETYDDKPELYEQIEKIHANPNKRPNAIRQQKLFEKKSLEEVNREGQPS